jgi:hypothetical protein
MNKATLVFVCNDNDAIVKVKQSFVEFFGMRMIEDTCPDSPILKMNGTVDSYDMNTVGKFVLDNMTVLVITADESYNIMSQNYSYVQAG